MPKEVALMKIKNKRQLQAEKTKEAILESISEMIQERPISQITIREICNHTGISAGAFYHHFDSKEAAILYNYRSADHEFEKLERNGTPLENIRSIINTHIGLMSDKNINSVRSIYISHLVYHDEYFFSENRPIFQVLKEEIAAFTGLEQDSVKVRKLVWQVLWFCRGMMYNACIDRNEKWNNWPTEQVDDALQYFLFYEKQI